MSTLCYYPAGVSEAQWEILQLLLPKPKWRPSGPGRKPLESRRVLSGISYVNKTGCQRQGNRIIRGATVVSCLPTCVYRPRALSQRNVIDGNTSCHQPAVCLFRGGP